MAAARYHRPASLNRWDTDEHRLVSECSDAQTELIILGHALCRERPAAIVGCEPGDGVASDSTADSGERDRCADRFADHQFLAMALGEFVAIMAADPARIGIKQGDHGQLDHRRLLGHHVEQFDLERVDQILGIVEHHRLSGPAFAAFGGDQSVVQTVETIGLGGRTVVVDQHRLHPRIVHFADRRLGQRIIKIKADEDAKITVTPAAQSSAQHGGDHGRFVPRRNEHRNSSGVRGRGQRAGEGARVAAVNGQRAPQATGEINHVNGKVIDRKQQEAHGSEQRQFRR